MPTRSRHLLQCTQQEISYSSSSPSGWHIQHRSRSLFAPKYFAFRIGFWPNFLQSVGSRDKWITSIKCSRSWMLCNKALMNAHLASPHFSPFSPITIVADFGLLPATMVAIRFPFNSFKFIPSFDRWKMACRLCNFENATIHEFALVWLWPGSSMWKREITARIVSRIYWIPRPIRTAIAGFSDRPLPLSMPALLPRYRKWNGQHTNANL